MEDWQGIGLGGGGVTLLTLLWRAMAAVIRAETALTKLADALSTTLGKHVDHISEEKRHHNVVEGYLRSIAGAPGDLARTPSGRIPTQPHPLVAEEVSQ